MIKHWEILENKWTQNSAYVLGIQGEDKDSLLITGELSSFCALIDAKTSNFTHMFELLNVTDDDILQKIRTKIEEIVKRSALNSKDNSLSSTPLQISNGTLDFVAEGGEPFENIIGKGDSLKEEISSSSDGNQITLNGNPSLHLEETKTNNMTDFKKELFQKTPKEEQEKKPAPVKEEIKNAKEEKTDKKEKTGFFKRLFSFGKKKDKVKESLPQEGPLPIEQIDMKEADLSDDKEQDKNKKAKENKKVKNEKSMHGVVVQGTAFPAQELGAQKIKDVSLSSKPLLNKEQSEVLQSQVPLDDIFAAETICQFYDEQSSSSEPKIEKIEEPTPMPTPRVITITQNKVLEENLKQSSNKQESSPEEPVKEEKASVAPVAPVAQGVADKPQEPALPQQTTDPEIKKAQEDKIAQLAQAGAVVQNIAKQESANIAKQEEDNKVEAKLTEQKNIMPQINISEEEVLKVRNAAKKEAQNKPVQQPKQPTKPNMQKENAKPANPAVEKKQDSATSVPAKPKVAAASKVPSKPIPMPHVDETQIDGFDHTIQTTSIPVYKKSNWPIEMPIVPSFTLDNMDMSSNRFAHAAAMSIVENPGTMYNPFFVFGEGGCGKTHFLNAIGVEFAKKISQDKIFITNGVRFSRGVQRAIENRTIDKVKEFLDTAQVLIIDDIHLTAVNETNREFISQVLNDYVAKRKQLVISSKYPPQGLSRFEELTNFKLSQGWISELKPLRPNHFLKAYVKMALDSQVDLTEAQCRGFFGRENLTLGMISRDIKRAKVLRRRIKDSGSLSISYEQLLNYITAIAGEDNTSQLESLDLTSPLSIRRGENTNWGNFGFFFPKESADKFKWIVYATMQRAKELGIKGGFNFALKSAYSTEHIIASAFKIANVCDSKNLKAAIILGPDPKVIQPAIRDNFCDILSHMLEVMMIRCAIISYEDIKKPSSYVKVLGDVLK